MSYHLEYVDKPGKFDEIVDQDGIRVLIDSKALFSIIGSEMDWVEDKLRCVFSLPERYNWTLMTVMLTVLSLNSRTLISRTLAVAASRSMCRSCETILAPFFNIIPRHAADTTPNYGWKSERENAYN